MSDEEEGDGEVGMSEAEAVGDEAEAVVVGTVEGEGSSAESGAAIAGSVGGTSNRNTYFPVSVKISLPNPPKFLQIRKIIKFHR